jgi:hypothetical protein
VVVSKVFDWGPGGTLGPLISTTTNTYMTDSNYTSRYIFNRLVSSQVSSGANSVYTVYNSYDQYNYQGGALTDLTNPVPRASGVTQNRPVGVTSKPASCRPLTRTCLFYPSGARSARLFVENLCCAVDPQ